MKHKIITAAINVLAWVIAIKHSTHAFLYLAAKHTMFAGLVLIATVGIILFGIFVIIASPIIAVIAARNLWGAKVTFKPPAQPPREPSATPVATAGEARTVLFDLNASRKTH